MKVYVKDVVLKMYDKVRYRGKLCSVARPSNTNLSKYPCIEFLEHHEFGWGSGSNSKNIPDYKPVGNLDRYWNIDNGNEMIEVVETCDSEKNSLLLF